MNAPYRLSTTVVRASILWWCRSFSSPVEEPSEEMNGFVPPSSATEMGAQSRNRQHETAGVTDKITATPVVAVYRSLGAASGTAVPRTIIVVQMDASSRSAAGF